MRYAWLSLALCVVSAVRAQNVEISLATGEVERVRLDWQALPGQKYDVKRADTLLLADWTNVTSGGILASNVIGAYEDTITSRAQFFRVTKQDSAPPKVMSLVPADGAIAVASNVRVAITLLDETGIDTNTIRVSIGALTDLTLSSPLLSYTNATITFSPTEILGEAGSVISNSLSVADTLGYSLNSFAWSFQLERPAVVTNTLIPLTAPPGGEFIQSLAEGLSIQRRLESVHPYASTDEFNIQTVKSNTVLFSYTSAPPVMTNGTYLVSYDAAYPFYRSVLSNSIDSGMQQITAWTKNVPLTELLSAGSMSPIGLTPATAGASVDAAFNLLHVEFENNLSGTVLFSNEVLRANLASGSWDFVGDVGVYFDIFGAQLQSLDASASGTLSLDISPEILFHAAASGCTNFPLAAPVTHRFGGVIGTIPVWVEVIMEINAGYEYSAEVAAESLTRIQAKKELSFKVYLRDNAWGCGVENLPLVLIADPIEWQVAGTANAKIYIQPKLTVLAHSLAGLWADIKPYGEVDGWFQKNPVEYKVGLYFGMTSTLGIESRIGWYPRWEPQSAWEFLPTFRTEIWSASYPAKIPPSYISAFPDQTITEGRDFVLSGYASGTPPPRYTWYCNGSRIVGETGPEYRIASANSGHSETYSVKAQNSAGSVTTSFVVNVTSETSHSCDYLVVDLSHAPSATSYPVTALSSVPFGGWTDEYKTTKMVFRRIPAGTFTMGSPRGELGRDNNETQHQVTLTQDFYIGVFEVTQKQWELVMGTWPSYFTNVIYHDSRPVETVSYYVIRGSSAGARWPTNSNVDADSFMGRLRARTGRAFDLPTESQWEYAGRARATTALNSGYNLISATSDPHMDKVGRYKYNGGSDSVPNGDTMEGTAKVGSYQANQWGLYDIHGNVWEWCLDWYTYSYPGMVSDPRGDISGSYRVLRGGGWFNRGADWCRVAFRDYHPPDSHWIAAGFRTCLPLGSSVAP